jgi:DNA-directed RNA polymerase subunit N (RpoN/RPB10)
MIIPIKCVSCGTVLADKYAYYQSEVRRRKTTKSMHTDRVVYMTSQFSEKTPEAEVMDELGCNKMCCRRTMLTHVDIE